ncbi:MAG TPA: hypothetical protein VF306_16490 [Pirellulales bacterium]
MSTWCRRRGAAMVVGFAAALAAGCEAPEKVKPEGMGRARTPQAVDAYASRYGVSRQQARAELTRMADAADEEKALGDVQDAGVRMR